MIVACSDVVVVVDAPWMSWQCSEGANAAVMRATRHKNKGIRRIDDIIVRRFGREVKIRDRGCWMVLAACCYGGIGAIEKRWELGLWDKVVCDITKIHVI